MFIDIHVVMTTLYIGQTCELLLRALYVVGFI